MRKRLSLGLLVVALLFVGWKARPLVLAMAEVVRSDELGGNQLETADDVWAYLRAHPDRYALALFEVGAEDAGVFHDAETAWPLASTVKVIPLALASQRFASGAWSEDTPLPTVEHFYLENTDGRAHPKAMQRADGGIDTLGRAVTAMIESSDNAVTDALLFSMGREVLEREVPLLGALPVPHPLSGTLLLQLAQPDGGLDDAAWSLATPLRDDATLGPASAQRLAGVPIREQLFMAKTYDNRGSARAFAKLMETFVLDPSGQYAAARSRLSWPMRKSGNQKHFRQWGTKGGSLPGTLTSASYVETNSGQRRVLALFLHDLPFATWVGLSRSYAEQDVEFEVLQAENPAALLHERLGL